MKSRRESLEIQHSQEIRMYKLMRVPDVITLANAVAGMAAIFLSIYKQFSFAAVALLLAVVFDYLDGKAARFLQKQNEFGKALDSLSDVISFGVAPAVFGFMLGLTNWYEIIILVFFILCGVLRLARFTILQLEDYIGMPITISGIVLPVIYFLIPSSFIDYFILIYLLLGLAMISTVKIAKMK